MSEMQQILSCLVEIQGSVKRIEQRMDRLEQRMDKLEQRVDELEKRMEERFAEIDKRFAEIDKRFAKYDEKLDLLEFGLETEIQKVYDVAIANQANISLLMTRWTSNYSDGQTRQQVVNLTERVDVVEEVVESHSEAIFKLQHACG